MDSKKSNKIREIVRLQQILKKWKKAAANTSNNSSSASPSFSTCTPTSSNPTPSSTSSGNKGIKFLKRTLSFTDISSNSNNVSDIVPKGFLAVCVGKELKRFTIPTDYLRHQAFEMLLREAEEEFGFQQEGVLKFPCQVSVFEKILKVVEDKKEAFHELDKDKNISSCDHVTPSHHAQVYCR